MGCGLPPSERALHIIRHSEEELRKTGMNPERRPIFIDICASRQFSMWRVNECPCLTHARGQSGGYWITTHKRKMTVEEMMGFQGIQPTTVPWQRLGISKTRMGAAVGNAMSVNVLERLLPRVCYAAGIIDHLPEDKWMDRTYNPMRLNML